MKNTDLERVQFLHICISLHFFKLKQYNKAQTTSLLLYLAPECTGSLIEPQEEHEYIKLFETH